ncbi:hypothetical protein ACPUYX_08410 [Desulfosporosinus sp. SYSU MS00001]|uniref:hypothetical protein n=1 Tax=Desulfosporosinus sp. SYSU MS00001 TaxID=3416284 RepID=UPI003CEABC41
MIDRRLFKIILTIGVVLMVLTPISVNLLMLVSTPLTVGDKIVWIGFFGSFLGAIFGGLFTLAGIWFTIQIQENQKFIDTYVSKMLAIDSVLDEISRVIGILTEDENQIEAGRLKRIIKSLYTKHYNEIIYNVIGGRTAIEIFRFLKALNKKYQDEIENMELDENTEFDEKIIIDEKPYLLAYENLKQLILKYKLSMERKYNGLVRE